MDQLQIAETIIRLVIVDMIDTETRCRIRRHFLGDTLIDQLMYSYNNYTNTVFHIMQMVFHITGHYNLRDR